MKAEKEFVSIQDDILECHRTPSFPFSSTLITLPVSRLTTTSPSPRSKNSLGHNQKELNYPQEQTFKWLFCIVLKNIHLYYKIKIQQITYHCIKLKWQDASVYLIASIISLPPQGRPALVWEIVTILFCTNLYTCLWAPLQCAH